MSAHRMALRLLVYALCACHLGLASTLFNLSNDVTRFIPSCAKDCFISFLNVNYAPTTCGTSPSLQCLCATAGVSGFTIGEGALQCIVAENSIGFCQGYDADSSVAVNAYNMCSGQPGAIQPTHTAIVATLVAPSGGSGGVLIVPTPTTTTTVFVTAAPTKTTMSSPSITTTTSIASSSSVATSSQTTSASAAAATTSGDQVQGSGNHSSSLGTAQVTGIALGVAAAVGILVGGILLARRRRKKYFDNEPEGLLPMRDSWDLPKPTPPPNVFHISPPIHGPNAPGAGAPPIFIPPPYKLTSSPAATVPQQRPTPPPKLGLISLTTPSPQTPSTVKQTPLPPRVQSRLLPAKPMLSIAIPQISIASPPPAALPPARSDDAVANIAAEAPRTQSSAFGATANNAKTNSAQMRQLTLAPPSAIDKRESTMTEFEEDGRESQTRSAIWRPPSVAGDPVSATTYYVADRYGNWVLGDRNRASTPAAGAALTRVVATSPSEQFGAVEAPAAVPAKNYAAGGLAPPAEITRGLTGAGGDMSRSSSVYSQTSTAQLNTNAPPLPPLPAQNQQRTAVGGQLPRKASVRRNSHNSATTIATDATGMYGDDEMFVREVPTLVEQRNLSPVVESPSPSAEGKVTGRSPVSYPRIPGQLQSRRGSGSANALRLAPPHSQALYSPPGQPSPTLGVVLPGAGNGAAGREPGLMASYDGRRRGTPGGGSGKQLKGQSYVGTEQRFRGLPVQPAGYRQPAMVDQVVRRPADPGAVTSGSPPERQSGGATQWTSMPFMGASQAQLEARNSPQPQLPYHSPSQRRRQSQLPSPADWRPPYPAPLHIRQATPGPTAAQAQTQTQPMRFPLPPQGKHVAQQQRLQPQQTQPYQLQPPQQPKQQTQQARSQPAPVLPKLQTSQPIHVAQLQTATTTTSVADTVPTPASSLLAKRVGVDRANAFALPNNDAMAAQKWRRADLPATPGWQPKLTPSRRGDDLFLSVQ